MDATFIYMGYRGEDASRTRADSRRQSPWQSPSSTGPGAAASRDDGSRGYGQDDDGYGSGGYPRDDSYAGYEDYGQGQYGAAGGYGTTGAYDTGGYGDSAPGAAGGYGQRDAYRHADETGHPAGSGYAEGNGYASGAGYDPGAGYGLTGSYGQLSGYRDGGYGDSGYGESAYQGGGFGSGPYEQPHPGGGRHSRDAGNDWYNGQPGATSGSGFADTGVHNFGAHAIDSYTTGPRDPVRGFPPPPVRPRAELEAAAPQGLAYTGQQERYDDTQYDAYPAYGNQDAYDSPAGYSAVGGYQASPGYDDYDEPQAFGSGGYDTDRGYDSDRGYDTGPRQDLGRGYDDYENEGDQYQEPYGDDGTGPRPGGKKNRGSKTGRASKTSRGGTKKQGRKRSKRPLVLSIMALVTAGVVAAAVFVFMHQPKPRGNPSAAAGPLPTSGASASAATAACVKQLGQYCHIELRSDDPVPLTLTNLFPPAFTNETDHTSFTRIGTQLDKTCSNAVIGSDLISALKSDSCTQVLRASYVSGDNTIMGTIGVINVTTTNEAHHAGKVVGANDFISPLSTKTGIGSKLGSGTGVVEAEFKGHYLILTWAEFTNGKAPKTTAQDEALEQFESDLVAGSANIYLSQRMINGVKAGAS